MAYDNSGEEYALIFAKGGDWGTILRWTYANKYIQILRRNNATWQSDNWEKIYAGYADSSGSSNTATKATQDSDGNTINSTYVKLSKTSEQIIYNSGSDTPLGIKGNSDSGTYMSFRLANGTIAGYYGITKDKKPVIYVSGENKEIITSNSVLTYTANISSSKPTGPTTWYNTGTRV